MVLTPSTMVPLGTMAPDFSLPEPGGANVSRADFTGKPLLVMFMCNHCPYVVHIADTLAARTREFMAHGVAVVGINSNDVANYPADSPDLMIAEKAARGYNFPYLFDETQEVARAYDAACTPDFFLYNAEHQLVYRGQFDAARPGNNQPVTGETLAAAISALQGAEMPPEIPSMGCNIKWK
jgi:peroxiredoxin